MLKSLSHHAIAYTIAHLMRVAAPALSYDLEIAEGEVSEAVVRTDQLCLRFSILPPEQWPALINGTLPVSWIPSFDRNITVPIFLEEGKIFAKWRDRELTFCADLVTLSFLLLSRGEELLISRRDEYERFRYAWSLSKIYHLVDFPIVDEWSMLVRQELFKIYGEQELGCHIPSLTPTHDMDTARRFSSIFAMVRTVVGGDLIRLRSLRIAMESLRQYAVCRTHPELDPELLGAEMLLDLSLRYGLCSEFYFMGLSRGEDDVRYEPEATAVCAFSEKVQRANMVCGFHASRLTTSGKVRFQMERQRVANALHIPADRGRQHFLCFDALKTPKVWEDSGMRYDSTLAYPDHEGFRCGTCHAYPLYDLETDRPLSIIERPLLAMDGTLRSYRGLTLSDALASLKRIFERCHAVGGDCVVLWHNGCVFRDWTDWFQDVYVPFIKWAAERLGKDADQ